MTVAHFRQSLHSLPAVGEIRYSRHAKFVEHQRNWIQGKSMYHTTRAPDAASLESRISFSISFFKFFNP
jgi:hypothetical protein